MYLDKIKLDKYQKHMLNKSQTQDYILYYYPYKITENKRLIDDNRKQISSLPKNRAKRKGRTDGTADKKLALHMASKNLKKKKFGPLGLLHFSIFMKKQLFL